MEAFNLYMDEMSYPGENGSPAMTDIQFRVALASADEGNAAEDAVLSGLDIFDLVDLRNALQEVIDVIAFTALDPTAGDLEA